tara:strand:- start:2211 stop:3050 length:840 start_codon:yes stop_codon:yes gene_type:complete
MEQYLGGSAESVDKAKIVIVPVPFDGTSSWIKGADKGPEAIIDASLHLESYDIETDSSVVKEGIFTDEAITGKDATEMVANVQKRVSELLSKEKMVVLLGGEHSISIGSVLAFKEKFPKMCKLQIDAHADLLDEYKGEKFSHASVMARVKDICPFVQVGIRSCSEGERKDMVDDRVFFAKDIMENDNWMDRAISKLDDEVYVTIDLDALDPSIMPATGTPEPGGMGYWQLLKFLKKVSGKKKIVGFDVVELCPREGQEHCSVLGARLIYKLLSYMYYGK